MPGDGDSVTTPAERLAYDVWGYAPGTPDCVSIAQRHIDTALAVFTDDDLLNLLVERGVLDRECEYPYLYAARQCRFVSEWRQG